MDMVPVLKQDFKAYLLAFEDGRNDLTVILANRFISNVVFGADKHYATVGHILRDAATTNLKAEQVGGDAQKTAKKATEDLIGALQDLLSEPSLNVVNVWKAYHAMGPLPIAPFPYPTSPEPRRHGPSGYTQYQTYKEWLRDDYTFRCSYCLTREAWFGDGDDSFSIDHFKPQDLAPELICVYENLFYCCRSCNSVKGKKIGIRSPDRTGYGTHIKLLPGGKVEALTTEGRILIDLLKLNAEKRVALRKHILNLSEMAKDLPQVRDEAARDRILQCLKEVFGFPARLPDLSSLLPPVNSKPAGIESSYFAKWSRGELPSTY